MPQQVALARRIQGCKRRSRQPQGVVEPRGVLLRDRGQDALGVGHLLGEAAGVHHRGGPARLQLR